MPKKTKKGNKSASKSNKTQRLLEGMRDNIHPRQIKEIISNIIFSRLYLLDDIPNVEAFV